jgi:hypothetical protein
MGPTSDEQAAVFASNDASALWAWLYLVDDIALPTSPEPLLAEEVPSISTNLKNKTATKTTPTITASTGITIPASSLARCDMSVPSICGALVRTGAPFAANIP